MIFTRAPQIFRSKAVGRLLPVLLLAVVLLPARQATAQVTVDADEPSQPLMMFGFPRIERVLEIADQVTVLVGREDIRDAFIGMISEQFESMQLDPQQPTAQAMFMSPGFPPELVAVFCSPIKDNDTEAFLKGYRQRFSWMRGATLVEDKEDPGFYKFQRSPDAERGPFVNRSVRIMNGYAFTSGHEKFQELNLKGIEQRIAPLIQTNDLGFGVYPEAVPEGLRTFFVTFLRNAAEAELQQRDDEPDSSYRARKATGDYFLDLAEEILNQSDGASINLDFLDSGAIEVDARIDAQKDSQLSKFLEHFGGRPSRFRALAADKSVDSVNISMNLDEDTQTWLVALVKSASETFSERMEIENYDTHPVKSLFDSLTATLNKGHFDVLFQVTGQPRVGLSFVGAIAVEDGQQVDGAIRELLRMISEKGAPIEITVDKESHGGIAFHQIRPVGSPSGMADFFGSPPSLLVGAGQSTIWLAFGADEVTFLELANAVDVAGDTPPVEEKGDTVAIRGNYNIGRWVGLLEFQRRRRGQDMEAQPEPVDAAAEEPAAANGGQDAAAEAELRRQAAEARRRNREQVQRSRQRVERVQNRMFENVQKVVNDDEDNVSFTIRSSESGLTGRLNLGPSFTKMYVTMGITGFEMRQEMQREAEQRNRDAEEEQRRKQNEASQN